MYTSMRLATLVKALEEYTLNGNEHVEIQGICHISNDTKPGELFAALPGLNAHGIQFLSEAATNGAVAVLTDITVETELTQILVPNARRSLALISNRFHQEPSKKLKLIGVTGTNGKTTVSFLVKSIFEAAQIPCGLIGTIRYSGEQFSEAAERTTPESVDLHELLVRMLKEGSSACSMEVSSQGLDQHRVTGCAFEAGIFTNLTQDHLDYHKTMEQYFQAKRMLFDPKYCDVRFAAINREDEYGRRLIELRRSKDLPCVSFGFEKEADYFITFWQSAMEGTDLVIRSGGEDQKLWSPLIGKYNVSNIAAAYAAMDAIGIDRDSLLGGIKQMAFVPGRMERLHLGQPFNIIIDYAHTEDAFRQLLPTLRLYTTGRIIHIFGCRGERDPLKRPLMGRAAGELADIIVLTSDNPVHEDPASIVKDIQAGIVLSGNANVVVELNRAEAIFRAVKLARQGDTIVITGKGNETYQWIGDEKLSFDEREYFKMALQ